MNKIGGVCPLRYRLEMEFTAGWGTSRVRIFIQ